MKGKDVDATDEAMLVERLGVPVHVVEGDARNVKITTPEDLAQRGVRRRRLSKPSPACALATATTCIVSSRAGR